MHMPAWRQHSDKETLGAVVVFYGIMQHSTPAVHLVEAPAPQSTPQPHVRHPRRQPLLNVMAQPQTMVEARSLLTAKIGPV